MHNLLKRVHLRWRILTNHWRPTYVATKCGHSTKQAGRIKAYGVSAVCSLPLFQGQPEYCLECIAKMAVQCPECRGPIFVGDPVAVYIKPGEKEQMGCLRGRCSHLFFAFRGHWVPPGEIHEALTPIGLIMSGVTGNRMVSTSDITDPTKLRIH